MAVTPDTPVESREYSLYQKDEVQVLIFDFRLSIFDWGIEGLRD